MISLILLLSATGALFSFLLSIWIGNLKREMEEAKRAISFLGEEIQSMQDPFYYPQAHSEEWEG